MSDNAYGDGWGSMSMREAARLGGRKAAETCPVRPWLEEARSKAGHATAAALTHDERWDRASAGGTTVVERRGSEHMREIGEIGGKVAIKALRARGGRKKRPRRFQELAAQATELAEEQKEEKC